MSSSLGAADGIELGIDEGTEMGSSDGSLDGSNEVNLLDYSGGVFE